jgi:hypothetical protein
VKIETPVRRQRWYANLYPFLFHLVFSAWSIFGYSAMTGIFSLEKTINWISLVYHLTFVILYVVMAVLSLGHPFPKIARPLLTAMLVALPTKLALEVLSTYLVAITTGKPLVGHICRFSLQLLAYLVLCYVTVKFGLGRKFVLGGFKSWKTILPLAVGIILILRYVRMYDYYLDVRQWGLLAYSAVGEPTVYAEYIVATEFLMIAAEIQFILFPCIFLVFKQITRPKAA